MNLPQAQGIKLLGLSLLGIVDSTSLDITALLLKISISTLGHLGESLVNDAPVWLLPYHPNLDR
jgi:hypothetical protein